MGFFIVVLLATVVAALGVGLFCLAASIYSYGRRRSRDKADVAIVLGAAIWGRQPSPVFRERINHGIVLYRAGVVSRILMTGGWGNATRAAESEVARDYAIAMGVPPRAILIETSSRTTKENMIYAKRLMEETRLRTALIVSDPIHMKRAMLLAREVGIDARPSPTPTSRFISPRKKLKFLWSESWAYARHRWLAG